jgi:hypothetical protein
VPIRTLLNDATSDDSSYEEDWRLYYSQRRSIFQALAGCAVGAAVSMSIFAVVPDKLQSKHAATMYVVGAVGALFLLATAFQWFRFSWTLGGWTCPRCLESFFCSTFVRNPFGRYCRHCNLRRPSRTEVVTAPLS